MKVVNHVSLLAFFVAISLLVNAEIVKHSTIQERAQPWPDLPFTTRGRDIISASGRKIVFAGVNWPGAADTMLPEGLQYESITNIVSRIKSLQMNVVRLTYAIEMIDDIYDESPNQSLRKTLVHALGREDGTKVLGMILEKNPQFTAKSTRLEVFDAVASECARQHIWVHLDNHVSKAKWCCDPFDGNSWFGDEYFNVEKWQRGLGFMARHVRSWKALSSMSLRNELRPALEIPNSAEPYTWATWYKHMVPAMRYIHSNNSLPLIFVSGLTGDTDDSVITRRLPAGLTGKSFAPAMFSFGKKIVFELHNYLNSASSCDAIKTVLYNGGYGAMDNDEASFPNHAPVVLSEFGFSQSDDSYQGVYAQCIRDYILNLPGGPGGWMQWVLAGSYYIRTGVQDSDDPYGLLEHDWAGWRNSTVIDEYVRPFVRQTLG